MEETQKIFEPTPIQGEETLVSASDGSLQTPRFDEVEAQVARPVVPLAGSSGIRGVVGGVRRRQWPIALVLISALAGGVVSLLAFRLYQQRQQTQPQVAAQADTQTPETNETNAAEQTAEPTPLAQTAATETETQAQTEAPVVFEEFDPAKEGVATAGSSGDVEAKPARKASEAEAKPSAGKDERASEAKPAPRANAESKPRLVEVITTPRGENVSRDERRRDDDYNAYEDRRERRRERREQRREGRRGRGRNIDRIKDIFEGPPPA
jgi:hypothetical protein